MLDRIIAALIAIESGGVTNACNQDTMALGALQIRRIMVHDVNQILKGRVYRHEDAYDLETAIKMAKVYFGHYLTKARLKRAPIADDYALSWRWGPKGPFLRRNEAMEDYLQKFRKALQTYETPRKVEEKTVESKSAAANPGPVVESGKAAGG